MELTGCNQAAESSMSLAGTAEVEGPNRDRDGRWGSLSHEHATLPPSPGDLEEFNQRQDPRCSVISKRKAVMDTASRKGSTESWCDAGDEV
jgi:hypothetical protein